MEISYEEAMRRIAKSKEESLKEIIEMLERMDLGYEKTMHQIKLHKEALERRYCTETKFPRDINIYRGEGQILVVPLTQSMFWLRCELGLYCSLNDSESAVNIGKTLMEVFDYLNRCPVDTRTMEECAADSYIVNYTTCKTYKSFCKKYSSCYAGLNEDGTYIITPTERLENYKGYGGVDTDDPFRFKLPKEASEEEIGNAVIAALDRSDELKKAKKPDPYPPIEAELLSDKKVEIHPPRDRHFTDMQDGSAAEIYRLYEYSPKEGAEPSANFYLGIAEELDCDLSEENIRKAWEELHGKAELFEVKPTEHGIFKLRAEMRNKSVHRISYILQIDESELLDCTMELHKPNTRKKLDEKLSILFEEFALDILIKN